MSGSSSLLRQSSKASCAPNGALDASALSWRVVHTAVSSKAGLATVVSTCAQGVHTRAGPHVFALGPKLRCVTEYVGIVADQAQRLRIHEWMTQKKPQRYAVYTNWQRPWTTTWVDQAHHALDRQVLMIRGFHHPPGHQRAFLNGLALLYDLLPYQSRAKHAGRGSVPVEGGTLPTSDGYLDLHILTCGGLAMNGDMLYH